MATTKVRGITIELGADTSGINKALTGVNKEIGSTQKQLKDVERLLKLDPTNTDLLEQRQRLLGDAVGQTSSKLETLKKAQEQVSAEIEKTGEGQEQYDALQREIINCENELERLEKRASESNATIAKIGETAGKISDATGKMADKTKGLSMAAGGALTAIGGLAIKAGKSADELNTLSQKTGLSTEELQKMQYASELIDVPVDTITGSLTKLKKNMASTSESTQKIWSDLGVSIRDNVTGEFRNVDDVFYETVDALSKIENDVERDTVAMEIFGKSADELAGIIDDGGESLKQLGEEAKNKGLIISQEDLDAANEMNDAIDKLKAEATGTFAQLGSEVAQMLLPYIPQIEEALRKALEVIKNIDPEKLQFAAKILAVVAAISPLFSIISKVTGTIKTLYPIISALTGVIGTISGPILIAVAAIALLATKGDYLQSKLQELDNFLQNIFVTDFTNIFGPVLGGVLNGFMQTIKTMWDAIKKIFDGIIDFIRGVFTGDWKRAWNGVKEIFKGVFDALVGIAKAPLNAIISLINGAINGINSLISGLNSLKFDFPSWIPGLGGKSFGLNIGKIPNIPMLANGGTIFNGSAIVGEAGAEFLNVSNGAATVTPLTGKSAGGDITGLLENIYSAVLQGQNMYIDGNTLVGSTAERMNDALGRIAIRSGNR